MKKVITYGTFDLLHVGHINLLRRAKALGDYLIVVVSSDEFNAGKGKKAYHSFEDRKKILEAIRYVDEVLPEYNLPNALTFLRWTYPALHNLSNDLQSTYRNLSVCILCN